MLKGNDPCQKCKWFVRANALKNLVFFNYLIRILLGSPFASIFVISFFLFIQSTYTINKPDFLF